jgi:hypothetical protein
LPAELADEAVDGFMEAFSSVVAEVREEMGTASL